MKKKLKKGAAIETAIMLMFMLVALSVFLTSLTILATNNKVNWQKQLTQTARLQTVGNAFLTCVTTTQQFADFENSVTDYQAVCEVNGANYTLTLSDNNERVLYVHVQKTDETYTVLAWQYN